MLIATDRSPRLPFLSWCRLLNGSPWKAVRSEVTGFSESWLRELDEIGASGGEGITVGQPFPPGASLEVLQLKLEALGMILKCVSEGRHDPGHALNLTADRIWMELSPRFRAGRNNWEARSAVLMDVSASEATPLMPQECAQTAAVHEGYCILRGPAGLVVDAGSDFVMDFLPSTEFATPPRSGDPMRLVIGGLPGSRESIVLRGKVNAAFKLLCRMDFAGGSVKGEVLNVLTRSTQVTLQGRLESDLDHSLVDTLHAIGVLWIAALSPRPGDIGAALGIRDELARVWSAGESFELLRVESALARWLKSSAEGNGNLAAHLPIDLLARCMALGLRFCGAVPGGYPGQNHESVDEELRARAYGLFEDLRDNLAAETRMLLLGGDPARNEILRVLNLYAFEHLRD